MCRVWLAVWLLPSFQPLKLSSLCFLVTMHGCTQSEHLDCSLTVAGVLGSSPERFRQQAAAQSQSHTHRRPPLRPSLLPRQSIVNKHLTSSLLFLEPVWRRTSGHLPLLEPLLGRPSAARGILGSSTPSFLVQSSRASLSGSWASSLPQRSPLRLLRASDPLS